MRLVLFGPPGAGKGTQAKVLKEQFGLSIISTGNLIRTAIREETPLGLKAAATVHRGGLVPDDVVRDLANEAIMATGFRNFILDGYPRTRQQAMWLDAFLEEAGAPLHAVISLDVPDQRIVERLSGRRIHKITGESFSMDMNPPPSGMDPSLIVQRTDDEPEAVLSRLRTYHEETWPVAEWYAARGLLRQVNGVGSLAEVTQRILDQLPTHA
jgi:adenylate kinase